MAQMIPAPPKVQPPLIKVEHPHKDVPIERRIDNSEQIKHAFGLV